jgi:hypothetical protein
LHTQGSYYLYWPVMALRFTATAAPPAERYMPISPMLCRMSYNFVDSLTALCFTASSAVDAWVFVYELSAVGGSYQLY